MKKMAGCWSLVLSIMMVLVLAAYGQEIRAAGKQKTIGILQYVEHAALDAAREGFLTALETNGYAIGHDIQIDYQNAQGDAANLSTISDRFVAKKVDLVLAIATPAAQSMAGKTTEIPILGTAITDYEVARLVDSNESPGGNVSGTTDMNPIAEQIEFLTDLVPDAATVGVLYTSGEDNSVLQAARAKEVIQGLGLGYIEVTISNSNEVQQAAQSLVKRIDALYVPTDNIISSAMPIVYGVTVEANIPVICGEAYQVINGGLATLGINYNDLGFQTGLMAIRVLEGASPASMPVEGSSTFDYIINGTVAREIGLQIPDMLKGYVVEVD